VLPAEKVLGRGGLVDAIAYACALRDHRPGSSGVDVGKEVVGVEVLRAKHARDEHEERQEPLHEVGAASHATMNGECQQQLQLLSCYGLRVHVTILL